jgi:hypothetical protein
VELPSLQEALVLAPLVTLTLVIVGVGFIVGYRSRSEHIATLKEWLNKSNK